LIARIVSRSAGSDPQFLMPQHSPRGFWVVVPAAGGGSRMGSGTPKQYAPLLGRAVIEWTIMVFLRRADCLGVVVALAEGDRTFRNLSISYDPRVSLCVGGTNRIDSVISGLNALADRAQGGDWILVHDAARPCLSDHDLASLLTELGEDAVGGLLAAPLADTLKQSDGGDRVTATVERAGLWRALTPQMFRYETLARALQNARDQSVVVTDDAQAIEMLGLKPRLVTGRADNIKITYPEDLQSAERILSNRAQS
jgi:2-C-methyl-D-erythritol 4-phosphate cytidylyltransferase